jgi:hypothetical protein
VTSRLAWTCLATSGVDRQFTHGRHWYHDDHWAVADWQPHSRSVSWPPRRGCPDRLAGQLARLDRKLRAACDHQIYGPAGHMDMTGLTSPDTTPTASPLHLSVAADRQGIIPRHEELRATKRPGACADGHTVGGKEYRPLVRRRLKESHRLDGSPPDLFGQHCEVSKFNPAAEVSEVSAELIRPVYPHGSLRADQGWPAHRRMPPPRPLEMTTGSARCSKPWPIRAVGFSPGLKNTQRIRRRTTPRRSSIERLCSQRELKE